MAAGGDGADREKIDPPRRRPEIRLAILALRARRYRSAAVTSSKRPLRHSATVSADMSG